MLAGITFLKEYREVFNPGDTIRFRKGINLIVGDQGTGKSSLFKLLVDFATGKKFDREDAAKICDVIPFGPCRINAFDHEKMNPRTLSYFGEDMQFQVASMFSSHGESVNVINSAFATFKDEIPHVFIMDEPDNALSIRSIWGLLSSWQEAVKNGNQVICIVHNPILIAAQDEVYDMGIKEWVKSKDFIDSMTPKEGEPLPRPWEKLKLELKNPVSVKTEKKQKVENGKKVDKIAKL